jgi:hypothetical protein
MDSYNSQDDIENMIIQLKSCETESEKEPSVILENTNSFYLIKWINLYSTVLLVLSTAYFIKFNKKFEFLVLGKFWYFAIYCFYLGNF